MRGIHTINRFVAAQIVLDAKSATLAIRKKSYYFAGMNVTQLWILIALGRRPGHAYGLSGRIAGLSYMDFLPSPGRVYAGMLALRSRGLIRDVWCDFPTSSPNLRRVFTITDTGWQAVRNERRRLLQLSRTVDELILRQAQLEGSQIQLLGGGLRQGFRPPSGPSPVQSPK